MFPLLVVALPLPLTLSLSLSFTLPLPLSVALPVPLAVLGGRAVVVAPGRGGAPVAALVPSLGAGAALVHARPLRSFIAEIQTNSCHFKGFKRENTNKVKMLEESQLADYGSAYL